jgi:hypothetical protein
MLTGALRQINSVGMKAAGPCDMAKAHSSSLDIHRSAVPLAISFGLPLSVESSVSGGIDVSAAVDPVRRGPATRIEVDVEKAIVLANPR